MTGGILKLGKFRLATILTALVFAVSACDSAEDRLQKHLTGGEELIEQEQYEKAVIEFRNALELDDKSVPAHLGMARIYERRGNYPAMVAHLNKALEVQPDNVDALVRLGQIMMLGNQFDEALVNADAALKADPSNIDAKVLRAGVSLRLGNSETAVSLAKEALEASPGNPAAYAVLIGAEMKDNNFEQALATAREAGEAAPDDFGIAIVQLQVLERMGKDEEVGQYLKEMVERFPDQTSLRVSLGRWYLAQGDDAGAEGELRAVAAMEPENSARALAVANFLEIRKGVDAARAELEDLISSREKNGPFRIALARLEYNAGDKNAAKDTLRSVIETASDDDDGQQNEARVALAGYLISENDAEGARKLVEDVLAEDSSNIDALTIRAALYFDAGDLNNALLDVRSGLAVAPDDPRLLLLSARTQLRTGNLGIAGENFSAALQASDYNPEIAIEYANFLKGQNRLDAVAEVLSEAVSRNPDNGQLLTELANVQLNTGDFVGANQTAEKLKSVDENISRRVEAASLSGREQFDESIAILRELSEDPEQQSRTLAEMVQVYYRAGKIDEAYSFLGDIISENPKNTQALLIRATLNENQQKLDAAEMDLRSAIASVPEASGPVVTLARFFARHGRIEDTVSTLQGALGTVENDAGVRLFLGNIFEAQGKRDEAVEEYRAVISKQPNSAVAVNNLVNLLIEYYPDDPAAAAEANELAVALKDTRVPAFQDTYGWVMYRQGDYEEALRALRPAVEALPDNPYVQYHAGMAYKAIGDARQARVHLENAAAALDGKFEFADAAKKAMEELDQPQ